MNAPAICPFTHREREVLALVLLGQSNKEVALTLAIAESNVKDHIYKMCRKANVRNRIALVVKVVRMNWDEGLEPAPQSFM